jgi:hypothetical protein
LNLTQQDAITLLILWPAVIQWWALRGTTEFEEKLCRRPWSVSVIFPMAFTPVEYYCWCDDRPEYPTCFPLELRFSGSLDHDCFARA